MAAINKRAISTNMAHTSQRAVEAVCCLDQGQGSSPRAHRYTATATLTDLKGQKITTKFEGYTQEYIF